jgi:hypothetical protein
LRRPLRADVRVVRRDRIGCGRRRIRPADVDPQDLAEQGVQALAVALRVAAGTAVTHPDIEHPVVPEREAPAVVVRVRLGDGQEHEFGRGVSLVRRGGVDPERGDDRTAVPVRVVHEEPRVGREVGVEGEAQQALLATRCQSIGDVEERRRIQPPIGDDPDGAALLDHEDAPAPVAGRRDIDRGIQHVRDDLQGDPVAGGRCRRRRGTRRRHRG